MDFELSTEQKAIQELARSFASSEVAPNASEWDRDHGFPRELLTKAGELGLMGVCVPEEFGGAGADYVSCILVLEEFSRADASVGVAIAVHTSAVTLPIVRWGTEDQKQALVPGLASGEQIGAFALTESGSGSDARSLETRAERNDNGWKLTGTKQWITNAAYAGVILLFARSLAGVTCFVLDGELVGVTVTEEAAKLGLRSSSTADLVLDGAPVSADRLLGDEGRGFQLALETLDGSRIGIAAQAVGIAQAAYETARSYALEREQFGRPIARFQAIQMKLADMATEIDAARQLVYRAAWLRDQGRPHGEAASKAKLYASSVARRQTGEAIQILGGYGYMTEFPVERYYRDAKVTEIYEGTSEVQRLVIARSILGLDGGEK